MTPAVPCPPILAGCNRRWCEHRRHVDAAALREPTEEATPDAPPVVCTVGHSTRELDDLVRLLQAHAVACVADVRTVPRSRRNPQFNCETLPDALRSYSIDYVHLPARGRLRHPRADSPNMVGAT